MWLCYGIRQQKQQQKQATNKWIASVCVNDSFCAFIEID